MRCKFCAKHQLVEVNFESLVSAIPAGLSRAEAATFIGYRCQYCRSVENSTKFDPSCYVEGYYSKIANYERQIPSYDYTGNLVKYLKSKKGSVLDLGAGQGAFASYLKLQGLDVDVVEPDLGYQKVLLGSFDKVYSNLEELQKKYDTVVSIGVLEHVDNPIEHILDVFEHALDEDGELICQYPNTNGLTARLNFQGWDMLYEAGHNFIPSAAGLKAALNSVGIKIIDVYSSSITSRGRIPFFPARNALVEQKYKKLCDKNQLMQWINLRLWGIQSNLGLGETIVVHLKRD